MSKDDEYMYEINRLEGERDYYKRRSGMLAESLDDDVEIRAAACEWYGAWKGRSVTAMKDANFRLRKAVEQWRNRGTAESSTNQKPENRSE